MAKNDNLKDLLTDVADAIREKKGTTDLINPQDFGEEIRGIESGSSMWTGHVDVEGLKAIGWNDEDIAYFQKYGVNWDEEDDELHKVSEDNKALYGVVTLDNVAEYKDKLVYLPKVSINSARLTLNHVFNGFSNLVAIPIIDTSRITEMTGTFKGCYSLLYIPAIDFDKVTNTSTMCEGCTALLHVAPIKIEELTANYMFQSCCTLNEIVLNTIKPIKSAMYMFYGNIGLKKISGTLNTSNVQDFRYMMYDCRTLVSVPLIDMKSATNVSSFAYNTVCLRDIKIQNLSISISLKESKALSKESLLFIINNEAATSAITITLHASTYARLSTNADIVEALNNHPLVTLASA